jgi:Neprosin
MRTVFSRVSSSALLAALLCAGCMEGDDALLDEAYVDESDGESALPPPRVWNAERPVRDAAAARRQREVDRFIRDELYPGYEILDTTQTYSGDVVDWLDPASVPGSQIQKPPPIPAEELPSGVERGRTELEEFAELRGPAGSIPMIRPQFEDYVSGEAEETSFADYLARVRRRPVMRDGAENQRLAGGALNLISGWKKSGVMTGTDAALSHFIGYTESGTFSLVEATMRCDAPTGIQLVGAAVGKFGPALANAKPRLWVEFLTLGTLTGNYIGGWDGNVAGFVPAEGRPYGPGVALQLSIYNGAQYDSRVHIENFSGNWWISHNGNWLGYYPGWMFSAMSSTACMAQYYGEVGDPDPSCWTTTDMGSGHWAATGFRKTAYVRNPYYIQNGVATWLGQADLVSPYLPNYYTVTNVTAGPAPNWSSFFYVGGPGRTGLCF